MGDETFLSQLVDSRLLQMDYLTGCLKVYKAFGRNHFGLTLESFGHTCEFLGHLGHLFHYFREHFGHSIE